MKINKKEFIKHCFGDDVGDVFIEALGELKIEREIKELKKENKNIDSLSADEFKKRYGKWLGYELKHLREKEKELNK